MASPYDVTPRPGCPTVLDWSDERGSGNGIMVTLKRGLCFDYGCHVRGFDTVKEATRDVARKRLHPCDCEQCQRGEE